ncbi:MAG: hypothetical protein WBH31_03565 [Promethearchaeia archaeon]
MNFIKTLLVTLAIYLGLNAVFALLAVYVGPLPDDDPLLIITLIFAPVYIWPYVTPDFAWITGLTNMFKYEALGLELTTVIFSFLGMILPSLLAVIIGGLLSDTSNGAFVSWFLTAQISGIVYMIIMVAAHESSLYLNFFLWDTLIFLFGPNDLYFALIISGIINGFFYGCISYLVTRKKL